MIVTLYSVRDAQAQAYTTPFFQSNDGVAIRQFQQALMSGDSPMAAFPHDYNLYRLGTLDLETGKLETLVQPVEIAQATQFAGVFDGPEDPD